MGGAKRYPSLAKTAAIDGGHAPFAPARQKPWRNSVALPLLLGRHLARRPRRLSVHLLSRTSLIREPCFLSSRVLGPPLGPFEPFTGLQRIRRCSLQIHQSHLAATFQIITHGTPLPSFCGGIVSPSAGMKRTAILTFSALVNAARAGSPSPRPYRAPRLCRQGGRPSCQLADSFQTWRDV
jgi:hypothetical protein